jgi:hypothetical protein
MRRREFITRCSAGRGHGRSRRARSSPAKLPLVEVLPVRAVRSQGIICGDRDEKKGSGHHAEKGYGE